MVKVNSYPKTMKNRQKKKNGLYFLSKITQNFYGKFLGEFTLGH